jgi:predicted HTH domain antitoxin
MTRTQFEDELHKRGIAIYRPTLEDLENDIKTLKDLGY